MFLPLTFVDVATEERATGLFQFVLVFPFAAIPAVETLVVVPVGIGLGLNRCCWGLSRSLEGVVPALVLSG
ncbi:hypothetical protein [Halovenus amylolytica]|uniref:hypothetical protein n=1 Tax=Halovenus amylolytica TaxID=2500550 RepID=UPI003D6C24CD